MPGPGGLEVELFFRLESDLASRVWISLLQTRRTRVKPEASGLGLGSETCVWAGPACRECALGPVTVEAGEAGSKALSPCPTQHRAASSSPGAGSFGSSKERRQRNLGSGSGPGFCVRVQCRPVQTRTCGAESQPGLGGPASSPLSLRGRWGIGSFSSKRLTRQGPCL